MPTGGITTTTLSDLVAALAGVVDLVRPLPGPDAELRRSALVDAGEVQTWRADADPEVDVVLLVGTRDADALRRGLQLAEAGARAIVMKLDLAHRAAAAQLAGADVAVLAVDPGARWAHVAVIVERILGDGADRVAEGSADMEVFGSHNDLFGLANTLSSLTNGMVTIDDNRNRVLAFSPLDESADDIRKASILGRQPPPGHLEILEKQGVLRRLRESADAFVLEGEGSFRKRLCIGIKGRYGEYLGTIWVQEGRCALAPDSAVMVRSAAALAAQLIDQSRSLPRLDAAYARQLLGATGPGVIPGAGIRRPGVEHEPTAVVGFSHAENLEDADVGGYRDGVDTITSWKAVGILTLHARSFRSGALVAPFDGRLYAIVPQVRSADEVSLWARHAAEALRRNSHRVIHAAVSEPVTGLSGLLSARTEVDRLLGAAWGRVDDQVLTMADMRTAVLIEDLLRLVRDTASLHDERLSRLADYDRTHRTSYVSTAKSFVAASGSVTVASDLLHLHPNTIRYRLRRINQLVGLDLFHSDDRFLAEVVLKALY